MANTQGMAVSFKQDLLNGLHAFGATNVRGATTKDSFYGALYLLNQGMCAGSSQYGAPTQGVIGVTASGTITTTLTTALATVTAMTYGQLVVGQIINASTIPAGTYVASIGTYSTTTQTGTITLSVSAGVTAGTSTAFTSTGEVTNGAGSGYTLGGQILTTATAPLSGTAGTATSTATTWSWPIGSNTITTTAGTGSMPAVGSLLSGTGIPTGTMVVSTSGTWPTSGSLVVSQTNGSTAASTGTLSVFPATAFFTPSASVSWTTFTSSGPFDTMSVYNFTQTGNHIVSVHTFGTQNVSAGTFTLTMPVNAASTALLNLA